MPWIARIFAFIIEIPKIHVFSDTYTLIVICKTAAVFIFNLVICCCVTEFITRASLLR